MTTCVVNQCHGYWLLFDALTFAIKLYVKLTKEKLELQAEVDACEEMDMRIKVEKPWCQHVRASSFSFEAFFNFMDYFKLSKVHNMVGLMLDP